MNRLLVGIVLAFLAVRAEAATFEWGESYDAGTPGVQASQSTFTGGVSATLPPIFRAQGSTLSSPDPNLYPASLTVAFPGQGNRAALDFDSSATGGASYAVSTFSADSDRTAEAYVEAILGPPPTCFGGGALNGKICSFIREQDAGCGTSGVCRENRTPLVTHATASAAGCTVYLSQSCGSVDKLSRVCNSPQPRLRGLYGGPYTTPGSGVCGASRTMADTPCGGPCSSTSDCLQGRPDAVAGDPTKSEPTACVSDRDPAAACDGAKRCAAGSNVGVTCTTNSQCPGSTCQSACYCVNECDEIRKGEATCAPKSWLDVNLTRGEAYALAAEQINQADPGVVQCRSYGGKFGKLCAGGANDGAKCSVTSECPSGTCLGESAGIADDVSLAFQRGSGTQKVGICTGGSTLAGGGRQGTACAQTARNGTDPGCQCGCYGGPNAGAACTVDSQCPGGTCPAGCTAGTCTTGGACAGGTNAGATCSAASACPSGICQARITPDRVQWGWNDGTDPKARVLLDATTTQVGSSPKVNVRQETLTVDGGTDVWSSRTGCGTANQGRCFRGGAGTIADEPDGNASMLNSSNESVSEIITFANLASTAGTPLAATITATAQDRGNPDTEGIIVAVEANDGTTTTTGYNPSNATPDGGGSGAGYLFTTNRTRGSSGDHEPMPPKVITTNPTGGGALTTSTINALQARITKTGYVGGTTDEGRISFVVGNAFLTSPDPDPPNVLPGGKVGAVCCDSTSNASAFHQALAGLAVEPVAIYDQASGGISLGDVLAAAPTLVAGGSTSRMPTTVILGSGGQHVDFLTILATANTFNGLGTGDPANPLAFDGLLQAGHCESWISGSGYTASQGKPCNCDEVSNWTSPNNNFVLRCMMKNASFGLTTDEAFCLCGSNADCSLGGASPSGATATSTTCTSGTCTNTNASMKITAAAGTRSMAAPACLSSSCPNGMCVQTNSIARVLRGKRDLDALLTAAGTHPIWVTQPIPNGEGFENERPAVEVWNSVLLTEQKATGGDWIDWAQYFLDQCGPSILTKKAANPCTYGVHYTVFGNEKYAEIVNACWSNTTLDGVEGRQTDGVCTSGPTCSGGKCASGLRQGIACAVDADCTYCSGGAVGKLGRKCNADADCGYYKCF